MTVSGILNVTTSDENIFFPCVASNYISASSKPSRQHKWQQQSS